MIKLKNSKYKNTGILYELLTRQLTSDILNNRDSNAIGIIKEFFRKNSELQRELLLYQSLLTEKFGSEYRAINYVDAIVKSHRSLNHSILSKQKYNLIKEIKKFYNISDFFNSRITNYTVLASTYKLFEYKEADDPTEIVRSKNVIVDHIITTLKSDSIKGILESKNVTTKDIRLLTYKILVEKFNSKYSKLDNRQKDLLREYVNNVSNSIALRDYVISNASILKNELKVKSKHVTDEVVRIKLTEVLNILHSISKKNIISDDHVLLLLKYYELDNELEVTNNG